MILKDNKILRCPTCLLIPSIKVNRFNNELEYECSNNHKEKGKFNEIYCKLIQININECSSKICKNKSKYYCIECYQLLCDECCKINNNNKHNHNLIDIKLIDKICFEHKETINSYCVFDKKNLCNFCEDNHNTIFLNNLFFSTSQIEEFKRLVNEVKNNSNSNDFMIILFKELKELLLEYIKKINDFILNYNKYKDLYASFLSNLICIYENNFQNKILNYNIINNINLNFETKNFEYNLFFEELNQKIEKIKNNVKLNLSNEIKFLKNIKNSWGKLIFLNDNKILSYDISIYIFDTKKSENAFVISFNKFPFIRNIIQLKNNILIIICKEFISFVRLFNEKYEIITKFNIRKNKNFIELENNKLISYSSLGKIFIWNNLNNSFKIEKEYNNFNNRKIKDLIIIKENLLALWESDNISFFNYEKNEVYSINNNDFIIENYNNNRNCLFLINENILVFILQNCFYFIDINNHQIIKKIEHHIDNLIFVKQLYKNIFLMGNKKGLLYKYSINEYYEIKLNNMIQLYKDDEYINLVFIEIFDNKENYLIYTTDTETLDIWKI